MMGQYTRYIYSLSLPQTFRPIFTIDTDEGIKEADRVFSLKTEYSALSICISVITKKLNGN